MQNFYGLKRSLTIIFDFKLIKEALYLKNLFSFAEIKIFK